MQESSVFYDKAIIGAWKWYKTSCCFRQPRIAYADSLPYLKRLKFGTDGVLQMFHDDTLKAASVYEVKYGLRNDDARPVLKIDHRTALLAIRGDTLIIDYGYMDLQTEFYLREK